MINILFGKCSNAAVGGYRADFRTLVEMCAPISQVSFTSSQIRAAIKHAFGYVRNESTPRFRERNWTYAQQSYW